MAMSQFNALKILELEQKFRKKNSLEFVLDFIWLFCIIFNRHCSIHPLATSQSCKHCFKNNITYSA